VSAAASSAESPLPIDITEGEFRDLARLVYDRFGIHLTDKKRALVRGRLNKVLRARNLSSFRGYLDLVAQDGTGTVLMELVDRIATNHTYFFREPEHFAYLQESGLARMTAERPAEVRLWCAGCATGEEAYTLAIVCREWALAHRFQGEFKILATDISVTALETAVKGEYSDDRVRLVPEPLRRKYLSATGPDLWSVAPLLRSMILFKRLNFMDGAYPFNNRFHAVFCRNVMIYFDRDTKNALVQRLIPYLLPGGPLFIGHSETLGRETFGLEYVKPSVYRKVDA
jgi:chemotaxis protein methyltransferase CheR